MQKTRGFVADFVGDCVDFGWSSRLSSGTLSSRAKPCGARSPSGGAARATTRRVRFFESAFSHLELKLVVGPVTPEPDGKPGVCNRPV